MVYKLIVLSVVVILGLMMISPKVFAILWTLDGTPPVLTVLLDAAQVLTDGGSYNISPGVHSYTLVCTDDLSGCDPSSYVPVQTLTASCGATTTLSGIRVKDYAGNFSLPFGASFTALPSNFGQSCQSNVNQCGEVGTGTYTCSGCSAITPVCNPPTIGDPPSGGATNSVCDAAGLVKWSGKSGLFAGKYGYSVDISLSANFATKYSKWIDSPVGSTGGSTILPTDIDWKGFNGPTDTLPGVHTWYVRVWNGAFSNTASFQTQTCLPTVDFNILYGSNKTSASTTIQFEEGNIATLEWTPTNATSCTASGNSSSWSGAKAFTGTNSEGIRDLNATGSPYTLTLTCNRGSSRVVKSFTVNVYKAAFIKTTGGNVHSNENIVTPGQ